MTILGTRVMAVAAVLTLTSLLAANPVYSQGQGAADFGLAVLSDVEAYFILRAGELSNGGHMETPSAFGGIGPDQGLDEDGSVQVVSIEVRFIDVMPGVALQLGGSFQDTDIGSTSDFASAGGGQRDFVSPDAQGALGGVIIIPAGQGDIQNLRHENGFKRFEGHAALTTSLMLGPNEVRPGILLQYGHTDVRERLSGITNVGFSGFRYDNRINDHFFGIGAGVDKIMPLGQIGGTAVGLFAGAWLIAQFHEIDGSSSFDFFNLNGTFAASERQTLDQSETTWDFIADGGLTFGVGQNTSVQVGAKYRYIQSPHVVLTGASDAFVAYEPAHEVTGFFQASVAFGTESNQ